MPVLSVGLLTLYVSLLEAQSPSFLNLDGNIVETWEQADPVMLDNGYDAGFSSGSTGILDHVLAVEIQTDGHNCCTFGHGAGCDDPSIETCVCDAYFICCDGYWSNNCIELVNHLGCGSCPVDYGGDRVEIDSNGAHGGSPNISLSPLGSCSSQPADTVCFKASPIATVELYGSSGRSPLRIRFFDPHGWTDNEIAPLIRSIGYRFVEDTPLSSGKTLRFSYQGLDSTPLAQANVTADLAPCDDQPVLTTNSPMFVAEGLSSSFDTSMLSATDVDSGDPEIQFTVIETPSHGSLRRAGVPAPSFTMQDIGDLIVAYTHWGNEEPTDSFEFIPESNDCCVPHDTPFCSSSGIARCVCASDPYCCTNEWDDICVDEVAPLGCGFCPTHTTFEIIVNPVNDPPTLVTNSPLVVDNDGTATISNALLRVTDADNTPDELLFTVQSGPSCGEVQLSGTPTPAFTQLDIDSGFLNYSQFGCGGLNDSFSFTVSDGFGGNIANTTFNILVSPGPEIFMDGFESGNAEAWSEVVGGVPGEAATGIIWPVDGTVLLDGETFTLADGITSTVTLEFDSDGGVTPGNRVVPFDQYMTTSDVRVSIVNAINSHWALNITASTGAFPEVFLQNDFPGAHGNLPITETVSHPDFVVEGMDGGQDPIL